MLSEGIKRVLRKECPQKAERVHIGTNLGEGGPPRVRLSFMISKDTFLVLSSLGDVLGLKKQIAGRCA